MKGTFNLVILAERGDKFSVEIEKIYIYRVSHELRSLLREGVPYVKLYRYNPKHLCQKVNGYGDNGQRKVWASVGLTHCTPSVMLYSSTAHARQRDITVHRSQCKVALTSQDNRQLRPA
jgi:hypothetical protein